MRLGIIINTNNPETAWNALRLGSTALGWHGAFIDMKEFE
jgi:hypothetical protein